MATNTITLKKKIETLKKGLNNKFVSASQKEKIKSQVEKLEKQVKASKQAKAPKGSSLTRLQKLVNKKKFSVYQGKGIDLKKDADQGALAVGRRVSKGIKGNQFGDAKSSKGNVYYEYRANRLDVKQPKKAQKYPKLKDGGYMARGGELKVSTYHLMPLVMTNDKMMVPKYDYIITFEGTEDEALAKAKDMLNKEVVNVHVSLINPNAKSLSNRRKTIAMVKDKMAKGGLTKSETLKVAEKFAKALSKTENKKVTINMRTLEEDSFDLDMDGIEYDGGSYNIYDNGDVKNMAISGSPVYGKTTSTEDEIVKNLSKMASGGKVGKHSINGYGTLKNGTKVYIGEGSQRYPNTDNVGVEGIYYDVKYQDGKEKLVHMDEIVFPIKGRMAKGGEVRFVDEFTTEDGIEISTAKTDDGKTLYGAQVTMYPLQKIIPFTSEDKNVVVERAKEIQSEMIEYLSKNEHRSDKLNQRFYAKGGKTKEEPMVVRGYFEDEAYEYKDGGYVAVSETSDGYWYIMSKPSTKENAELLIKMGVPRGEVGKVVTIEEAKKHGKLVGKEYLERGGTIEDRYTIYGTSDEGWFAVDKETKRQIHPSQFGRNSWETKQELLADLKSKNMAKGGVTNLDPYDLRSEASKTLIQLAEDIRNVMILEDAMARNSEFENNTTRFFKNTLHICENAKKEFDNIKDKYYKRNYADGGMMEGGGVTEKEVVESNAEMVLSQIKAVKHHAEELSRVVSTKSKIEAWVVGKIERASTDLSDITHYLEGNKDKMSMGGTVRYYTHKMDK